MSPRHTIYCGCDDQQGSSLVLVLNLMQSEHMCMYLYLRRLPVVTFQLDEQENMGADEGVELRHPQGGSRATPGVGGARKGEGRPCYICTVRYAGKHQGVRPLACRYVAGTDVLLFMQALTDPC